MNKKDFPIFNNNPGLVFLDSGASAQKPSMVIDGVSAFVANDYANIHRGIYTLSEKSEEQYHASKVAVAELIGCKESEIIYSYNSTSGINLVAQALVKSKFLKKGDKVLIGIWEHHSNILPWQVLAEEYGFTVDFVGMVNKSSTLKDAPSFSPQQLTGQAPGGQNEYDIDREDFDKKYDDSVKVVAMSQTSNVTGQIYNVKAVKEKLRDDTFFLIDGSQSVPNFVVDVSQIGCDCLVFTGHKMMAYTGIGVVYLKKERIKSLTPMIVGGGTVEDVDTNGHRLHSTVEKFEAGTPNIIGAVSLLKSIEYIKSIGGIQKIREHEQKIVKYFFEKLNSTGLAEKVEIVGPGNVENRIAVFSFVIPSLTNFNTVGEKFAEKNVAVRCGGHCAYPLHKSLDKPGTCRASFYLYNSEEDVDRFFEVLKDILNV